MSVFKMRDPGVHVHGDRLLREGDTIETDVPLDRLFPGRFVREGFQINGKQEQSATPDEPHIEVEVEEKEPLPSRLGDDVTAQFESAGKKDLKVYKEHKYYRVADADNIQIPVDGGDLTSKAKVEAFIKNFKG